MNNCKMAYHIIETSNPDKIQCENQETCDRVKVNVSSAGLQEYSAVAIGGPDHNKRAGPRLLRICDIASIHSSDEIVKK